MEILKQLLIKLHVSRIFRAAYRPGGNDIVERHHRTIKAVVERGKVSPREAVFLYNSTPGSGQDSTSVPQQQVYTYELKRVNYQVPSK